MNERPLDALTCYAVSAPGRIRTCDTRFRRKRARGTRTDEKLHELPRLRLTCENMKRREPSRTHEGVLWHPCGIRVASTLTQPSEFEHPQSPEP